jgi:hypothetical protein
MIGSAELWKNSLQSVEIPLRPPCEEWPSCPLHTLLFFRDKFDQMAESIKWGLFEVMGGWEKAREVQEAGGCRI